jgi:lysophospholipase L1-like esterase
MKYSSLLARCVWRLGIFVAVLELCARVDDSLTYGAPFWGPYNSQTLFVRDQIGLRGRPGARFQKWHLNSLGYRGPELRPGTVRIICIGASETFGLYEAEGRDYPRLLEHDLNARAGRDLFQVQNVAVVGQTLAAAVLRVPEIVDQVHPTFAIIYPSAAAYTWLPWVAEEPTPSAAPGIEQGETATPFQLRITERLRNLLKQGLPSVVQTELRRVEIAREIARNRYPVMDRVPEGNVRRFRQDLLRLVTALRTRGVEPVLVTHATVFGTELSDEDRPFLVAWRKFYPMLEENGFLDMEQRMNAAIRGIAAQEHVSLIDAASDMPRGRMYFGDFSHFTSTGAGVMAARLANGLRPLLDARLSQRN